MSLDVPYRSIPDMFLQRVAATPDRDAFGHPAPDDSGPVWLTWSQVAQRAKAIAAGLRGLGIDHEDRVAIISNTRIEWVIADLGIMCAGGATTTVYPTTDPEGTTFIVADSGSKVVIAENPAQAAKLAGADLPAVTHVVLIDGQPDPAATPPQLTLADLEVQGTLALEREPDLVDRIVGEITPDRLATLIYTSGTTGQPKGVELLHAGWCWEAVAQAEVDLLQPDRPAVPLASAVALVRQDAALRGGARRSSHLCGRSAGQARRPARRGPPDADVRCAPDLREGLQRAPSPTPRAAAARRRRSSPGRCALGRRRWPWNRRASRCPAGCGSATRSPEKLVFSKLQARLGGRIRVLVSGSAPLSKEIAEFFAAAGLPISEGYGLTETSAGNFVNRPDALKIGTVGQALGDLECRIDTDGEILLRGVPGHARLPQPARGDRGRVHRGRLLPHRRHRRARRRRLPAASPTARRTWSRPPAASTSRRRHIEGMFKALCPYTSQAVVDRPGPQLLHDAGHPRPRRASPAGPPAARWPAESYAEIVASPEARALVEGYVKELNAKLNRWETIKKFTILPPRPDHRGRRAHPVDEDQAHVAWRPTSPPRSTRCTRAPSPSSGLDRPTWPGRNRPSGWPTLPSTGPTCPAPRHAGGGLRR